MTRTLAGIFSSIDPPLDTFDLGADAEFFSWLDGYTDATGAWAECDRGDWMMWAVIASGGSRYSVVQAAAECVRLLLPDLPESSEARVVATGDDGDRWLVVSNDPEDLPRLVVQDVEGWQPFLLERRARMIDGMSLSNGPLADDSPLSRAAAQLGEAAVGDVRRATGCAKMSGTADVIRRHFPDPPRILGPSGQQVAERWASLAPTESEEDREWWWRLSEGAAQPAHSGDDPRQSLDVFSAPDGCGVSVFVGGDGLLYASKGRQFVPLMDRETMRRMALAATSDMDVAEDDRDWSSYGKDMPLKRAESMRAAAK